MLYTKQKLIHILTNRIVMGNTLVFNKFANMYKLNVCKCKLEIYNKKLKELLNNDKMLITLLIKVNEKLLRKKLIDYFNLQVEEKIFLLNYMKKLDIAKRRILFDYFMMRFTQSEIAEELHISQARVYKQLDVSIYIMTKAIMKDEDENDYE